MQTARQQFAASYRAIRQGATIESFGYTVPYSILRAASESKLSRERGDRRTLATRLAQFHEMRGIFGADCFAR